VKADAAGFFKGRAESEQLKEEADFNALKSRQDFKKLLAELAERRKSALK
jgi:hypothetical protein